MFTNLKHYIALVLKKKQKQNTWQQAWNLMPFMQYKFKWIYFKKLKKKNNDDDKLWGVATTLATKKKQWHFKFKKHKKVTTSLPLMEPRMDGCLLGSFKCCLKLIWLTWEQVKEEALGSKVLHKGFKKHKK
jgi:hypothetical protein